MALILLKEAQVLIVIRRTYLQTLQFMLAEKIGVFIFPLTRMVVFNSLLTC